MHAHYFYMKTFKKYKVSWKLRKLSCEQSEKVGEFPILQQSTFCTKINESSRVEVEMKYVQTNSLNIWLLTRNLQPLHCLGQYLLQAGVHQIRKLSWNIFENLILQAQHYQNICPMKCIAISIVIFVKPQDLRQLPSTILDKLS